ncbi:MAG: WYL domain-containing protein [Deltaproteobacteria bacterium]|nr:WYL domain-containing protein [Deltaproteobacteria bacterium]
MLETVADLNVSDVRFIAFDTETTGISSATDCIVEIAAVAFDEEFEQRSFATFVKPHIPIPREVIRIHGIDDSMVAGAPSAESALADFLSFLSLAGAPRVLVAHNAAFDLGFIGRQAMGIPGIRGGGEGTFPAEIVLDSCMLAKALLPALPTHRLGALASHFKIETGSLHRALEDVRALKGVFLKLLGLAADRTVPSGRGLTILDLVNLCGGYFVYAPGDSKAARGPMRLAPRIEVLEKLCGTDTKVAIAYESEKKGPSTGEADDFRYITPLRVKTKGMRIFIEAHCHRDGIVKTFRADRIKQVKVRDE